jgi:predicted molibdopterin-dependent oxidoreductase YjgC
MPSLRNRKIFISHAWSYNEHYWTLVRWFNDEPYFNWSNCSVPSHDGLIDKTSRGLSEGMARQIAPAQIVIVLAGMYAAHSAWIDYEIKTAQRMKKIIIGVRPWDQQRTPLIVQEASICPLVGWNRASVVNKIREYI